MTESTCPRCGASLLFADHGSPLFCPECGLPQLRVAEGVVSDGASAVRTARADGPVDWPRALRIVAAVAAFGVALPCMLPGALASGAVAGVTLLTTPALALVTMYVYRRRAKRVLTTVAGVRIGAVLGLIMGSVIAFVSGVAGFVLRYGYHSRVVDNNISQAIGQLPAQLTASMGSAGPLPAEVLTFLQSPELRAGSFIAGHVFMLVLLVSAASACGWMSAAILRARPDADGG